MQRNSLKIKFLKTPYTLDEPDSNFSFTLGTTYLPPIDMAIITGYLRKRGYDIDQDDLNIKMHKDNAARQNDKYVDITAFSSLKRVFDYIEGKENKFLEENIKRLLSKTNLGKKYDIFLLSAYRDFGISSILFILTTSKYLKKMYPSSNVILGGRRLYKFIDKDFFALLKKHGVLDYIIFGYGERSLEILFAEFSGNKELNKVPGLIYEKDGEIKRNPENNNMYLETLDFEGLPMEYYKFECKSRYSLNTIKENKNILIIPYRFANGCPYNCAFCAASSSRNLYVKKPDDIVQDLKNLKEKYNTEFFYFLDDTLNISKEFTVTLCQKIIKNKLKIYFTASVTAIDLDKTAVMLLYDAGCRVLVFGLDTASPRLLEYIHKRIDLNHLSNILKWTNEAGIWIELNIISGLPTEMDEDIRQTLSFINLHNYIDTVNINSFRLVHGSLLFRYPERYGLANIRRINSDLDKHDTNIGFSDYRKQEYAFDEVNGLKWKEKKKQIEKSTAAIRVAVNKINFPLYEKNQYLFYYFYYLKDKAKIKHDVYDKLAFYINIIIYFKKSLWRKKIRRITDFYYLMLRLLELIKKFYNYGILKVILAK